MKILRWNIVVGVLMLLLCGNAQAYARDLAIISNKDYPVNTISTAKVKEIYLGEKMSEGSVKIKPMDQNDEQLRRRFIERVMGTSVDGYKAYWIKKFFQEGITPPTTKASSSEMIHAVGGTTGGIGYVWADEVRGDSVKVLLKIDVGN
ncbi:MAG: hypothetical protein HZA08_12540 [Nitrospirae bacterium]|nr:hypothetical protein [Nitrospirota bacterium]